MAKPKRTVMIIDADDEGRSLLAALLAAKGYAVIEASDAAAAFIALDGPRVDLIVLDPAGDAHEVLARRAEREALRAVPLFVYAAKAVLADVANVAAVLRKPGDLTRLLNLLAAA